ncbi:MAG: hypothetical protein WBJ19_02435 [Rhodoferax sp.]
MKTQPIEPPVHAGLLPGEHAFEAWAKSQPTQDELSLESIATYKTLWTSWLSWCLQQNTAWDTIQVNNLHDFLKGPAPGQGVTRRPAINPDQMSSYTRQRYWRVLYGVYAYANKHKLIDHNPALDMAHSERPSICENDRQSQVLEPFVFAKFSTPASIEAICPRKTDTNWWHARDRAIIAVLVETGVTVTELIALRGMDIVEATQTRAVATPHSQQTLFAASGAELFLDVMETSETVGRTLRISPQLAPLVRAWLAWRQRLLAERSAMKMPLAQRAQFMVTHDKHGPLFVARRARSGNVIFPLMDPTSVYHTVSQALKRLRKIEQLESTTYVAKGPAIVRNTVIRRWIDEHGPVEAAAMAGLKNANSLRLKAK